MRGAELLTVIIGHVSTRSPLNGPIVVAAYTKKSGKREVAHYTILHDSGEFELMVSQGKYYVFAYCDQNGNLIYDPGEPAGQYGEPKAVAAPVGGVVAKIDVAIAKSGPPIDWRQGRPIAKERPRKLYSRLAGAIVDLDDALFSEERGAQGFWEPISFYKAYGGNIYFLEAYDPEKIPILFIHGAGGTPKGWKYFVDHIDRTRFQPWFFYYPSGSRMRSMSHLLVWKLQNLQIKYKFDTLYITAHSMGGLIAHSFITDHGKAFPFVKLFVSLATPWGGDRMAEYGVKQSPAVIPCWIDMQPEGDFIQSIYRTQMPDTVSFYMFYGHRGNRNPFRSNNDGTITMSSLLDRRPQAEAKMCYAFDEDHASIIYSKEVLDQYNAILNAFDAKQRTPKHASVGYLKLNFTYAFPGDEPRPWPSLYLGFKDQKKKVTKIALSPEDSGKVLGPFPCGAYKAMLIAQGVKTQKQSALVAIESDHANALSFVFTPDGTVSAYITAAIKPENKVVGMPGWQERPERNKVALQSITLNGNGIHRTVVPADINNFDIYEAEASRTDYCYNGYLRMFGVPAGKYELVIQAQGHDPIIHTYQVTPGKDRDFSYYELPPEK